MSKTTLLGEIEDGKLYTDQTLAIMHNRTREWVIEQFIYPEDDDGNPIFGVPFKKRGTQFVLSGTQIRLWHEEHARPGIREKTKG